MVQVLDLGEVRLLGALGDDMSVVGAARVSGGNDPDAASKGGESDARLIAYLMDHGHGTPFEHVVFQWYIKAPLFVVREWQRHRIASYNEQSGRYSVMAAEFYVPDHVRVPDTVNKQGSVRYDPTDKPAGDDFIRTTQWAIKSAGELAYETYKTMLQGGVAREMARLVLPLNMYTAFWFTINARSLMNFLALRNHDAAQWEIRQYAITLEEDFRRIMPVTHQAFTHFGRRAP